MSPVPDRGKSDLAATLPAAAAVTVVWDAIVVGAGPAGTATALRLARAGWRVLVVDRAGMPRPKVCGACLSPRGVAEITALVPHAVPAARPSTQACATPPPAGPIPLATVRLVAGGRRTSLPMPGGLVWSRESLDAMLLRAAVAAGADWLPHAMVESVASNDVAAGASEVAVAIRAREADAADAAPVRRQLTARRVVIAAGLADAIRVTPEQPGRAPAAAPHRSGSGRRGGIVRPGSRIGLGTTLAGAAAECAGGPLGPPPPGELVMAVAPGGYCGLVKLEDGRLDIAAAVDRALVARTGGPGAAIAAILAAASATPAAAPLVAMVQSAGVRATPPLTRTGPLVGGAGRVFRVGDAAGYVEPFTGEGMGWALSGARLLAKALLGEAAPAEAYARDHVRLFRSAHARVLRVARGVRHPILVAGAVRLAAAAPWMAARALPLVTGGPGVLTEATRCPS